MFREIAVTDIAGIRVGHAQDVEAGTGCTVLVCEAGATAGVDVRGGAPATRETDLLNPVNMVEKIHAVVLSGGSAFGLDAASGVMACLEERSVGFDVQVARVPIVCGASLFDLPVGSPKVRPDRDMGYTACRNAAALPPAQGNVGAGTGASVGKLFGTGRSMKGGFGHYGLEVEAIRVASVVAVNCLGDVLEPDTGTALAGLLDEGLGTILNTEAEMCRRYAETGCLFGGNTTIGVVVTNGRLSKPQAAKAASMAHDGFARAMRPAHSMWDGDTIFLLATGEVKVDVNVVGILGARTMARAIANAVLHAEPAYGLPAARSLKERRNLKGKRF